MSLDDQLADLWRAGATLSQIEQAIGVSRGAAVGRIHRLRKAGDQRFKPRAPTATERDRRFRHVTNPPVAPRQDRDQSLATASKTPMVPTTRKLKPVDEAVGNARPLRPAPEPSGPRLLVDLAAGRCKFPVSDPPPGRGVEMLFCAEPVAQPGANYCSRHAEIATRVNPSPFSPRAPSPPRWFS